MTRRRALTLVELLVVLVILAALAGMVVPMLADATADTQSQATETNLVQLRDVIMNVYRPDMSMKLPRPDIGAPPRQNHPQLRYLMINPRTENTTVDFDPAYRLGWRGPYLLHSTGTYTVTGTSAGTFTNQYGEDGDPAILDGWNRPIVIQNRLGKWHVVSAGPDGILGNADDRTRELD